MEPQQIAIDGDTLATRLANDAMSILNLQSQLKQARARIADLEAQMKQAKAVQGDAEQTRIAGNVVE